MPPEMARSLVTVTTPATERDLCTLTAVKLELSLSGSAADAILTERIAQMSAMIETHCRRVFARETVQEIFRDVDDYRLSLTRFPVSSITSVTIDGEALSSGDYEIDAEAGALFRLSSDARVSIYASKVTVIYTAGYVLPDTANPTLPADIQRACVLAATTAYLGKGRDLTIRSESAQDVVQVSYLDPRAGIEALPPQVAGLLAPYRMPAA